MLVVVSSSVSLSDDSIFSSTTTSFFLDLDSEPLTFLEDALAEGSLVDTFDDMVFGICFK